VKRYIVAPEAEYDLNEIKAYLTEEAGARVARQVLKQIKDAIAFLSRTPGAGHSREDLTSAEVRFWSVYAYLIIYKHTARPIEIVRILHGNRDVGRLLLRDGD
jgi:plasmid stabilization system protein ParE